jgi:dienelactone hydrolase
MRRLLVSLLLLLVVGFVGGFLYFWGSITGLYSEKRTPEKLLALLEPAITIKKPEGEGPFPAVLLYSGCEGLWRDGQKLAVMGIYSDIAVSQGVVAIVVDSFTPRGIDFETAMASVCTGWLLRGADRAGDVAVTIPFARDLPYVDPDRIAIAGWSHGGWTVMDFLAMPPGRMVPYSLTEWPEDPFSGLTSVYLTYPYCGFPALAPDRGEAEPRPTWSVHGTEDVTVNPADCDRAFELIVEQGAPVDVETIDGATHAFDRPDLSPESTSKYDPEYAELAYERFKRFLNEVLIPSGR